MLVVIVVAISVSTNSGPRPKQPMNVDLVWRHDDDDDLIIMISSKLIGRLVFKLDVTELIIDFDGNLLFAQEKGKTI